MQNLEFFQSLWAMEQRIPGQDERPMEENFRMAAEAGYHGLCIDPAVNEIDEMRSLMPLYSDYKLKCMMNAFPSTVDEMAHLLDLAAEMDCVMVNSIGGVMPMTVAEGVPVVTRWMREAKERDMPLLFETHRDCTLNDMHYTLRLMEQVPDMRLCADLSHYVIDREMRLPLSESDARAIQAILDRSDCFQGRVSNAEQVQVPVGFAQHQKWVGQFRTWWRDGMESWRSRNAEDATLVFLCELGPPPYAITGADGLELSDRWEEAKLIRGWVQESWDKLSAA
jgi:hypothetical protein